MKEPATITLEKRGETIHDCPPIGRHEIPPTGIDAPPIGLMPHSIWKDIRRAEIVNAIIRYHEGHSDIPVEWIEEYNFLTNASAGEEFTFKHKK